MKPHWSEDPDLIRRIDDYFGGQEPRSAKAELMAWLGGEKEKRRTANRPGKLFRAANEPNESSNAPTVLAAGDYWMTRQEAATYMKQAVKTLSNWATEKRGPKVYGRGGAKYLKSDLDRWMLEG